MVSLAPDYNFQSVIDEFFALKPLAGPHAETLRKQVRERATELFANPDMRYMPAFKILDLLAALVNISTAVAAEPQLRAHEATALLRANLSDNAPLIRQFVLDAALERARYEPMMITGDATHDISHRDLALRKRWQAMLSAHQALSPLPPEWESLVVGAIETVITAETFHAFRQGPLMQLFAEMLQTARHLHSEGATVEQARTALGHDAPLWKRYALKAARYGEKPSNAPGTLPTESRVPPAPLPGRHPIH